jgi:hypothetical protein
MFGAEKKHLNHYMFIIFRKMIGEKKKKKTQKDRMLFGARKGNGKHSFFNGTATEHCK